MAATKLKTGIAGSLIVAGMVAPWVAQQQSRTRLIEENAALRQQTVELSNRLERAEGPRIGLTRVTAPRLPAPRMAAAHPPGGTAAAETDSASRIQQFLQEAPRLNAHQTSAYLEANGRSAASLLAAFRATGEQTLLEEAMENFPDDPHVAFAAAFRKDASPEERRRWLEAFKRSAPENALASYLSASEYFKAGQTDLAIQDLNAAGSREKISDYTMEFIQNNDEVWRAAGYPEAEAKVVASASLVLPHLVELKQLNQHIADLAASYRQAGDEASAQGALQMGASLGRGLARVAHAPLITQLVGFAIERTALNGMDAASAYGNTGRTVRDRLAEIEAQRGGIVETGRQMEQLTPKLSPEDWISYVDRWRAFGEQAAVDWLLQKHAAR